jgi:hypothetical protein
MSLTQSNNDRVNASRRRARAGDGQCRLMEVGQLVEPGLIRLKFHGGRLAFRGLFIQHAPDLDETLLHLGIKRLQVG